PSLRCCYEKGTDERSKCFHYIYASGRIWVAEFADAAHTTTDTGGLGWRYEPCVQRRCKRNGRKKSLPAVPFVVWQALLVLADFNEAEHLAWFTLNPLCIRIGEIQHKKRIVLALCFPCGTDG